MITIKQFEKISQTVEDALTAEEKERTAMLSYLQGYLEALNNKPEQEKKGKKQPNWENEPKEN